MSPILQLRGLSKSFGAVVVADKLSYEMQSGEALGIIGPNGAGKTTMFNLITGTITLRLDAVD
jgi:branched-chain amino acid transport system ATP-binding protein